MNKSLSNFWLVAVLANVGVMGVAEAVPDPGVRLTGRAQFSFTPGVFVVQTSRSLYTIEANQLDRAAKKQLSEAADENRLVSLNLPRGAIARLISEELNRPQAVDFPKQAQSIQRQGSSTFLRGTKLYSFSDAHFLIQVKRGNEYFFRIKKSELSRRSLSAIEKCPVGDQISVTLPSASFDNSWNVANPQALAPAKTHDFVNIKGDHLTLEGTVLNSFSDPTAYIKSNNVIFQVQRSLLSPLSREKSLALSSPASRVNLSVPLGAVTYAWSTEP